MEETMRKLLLAGIAVAMMATPAFAANYRFVIVPKAMNNPFFDFARDGCLKRAKELGNIECIYKGPVEHEPATQAQIIQDFVTQKVDGLAISVADVAAMTKSIEAATAAGIPVITFDADAPGSKRLAYIGTNNKEFGVALGKQLLKMRPDGGKYAMVSGGPGAKNLAERVDGVREALKGSKWAEVAGSPTFCNDDPALAVQQMTDMRTATPDLAAIVPIGGWPMFAPEGFKAFASRNKKDIDSGKFTLVVADTLKMQLELLRDGYANALVGQRPFEMGEKAMDTLLAIKKGEKVPEIVYTGLDLVTKDNVAQMLK
ncbi:sugar ABC transporter substrate-binding protein [Bradyrhizobium sp. WBOS7]|uniref:Sugar ABC transporter substrate-binding protein n=2 Tax=Nitrobacteraceae TaxID=41294 RepID=A0AAE9SRP8_9BRAD|nr:sugar ABC transporter substrate-binding protein [Bradyrhizobium sp. WBOS2]MDD1572791.1 sugar ABC transporter substrate-binding protein [Bradyrhizobium sp. WBOS1]MDD1578710.1 sugar ABC transporter substrate-binding protein [Bradyrhizobium sp. WBOS7]MDD1603272.1 sugar ABC transporter substrate-binding protein [Bradyrhizobium sp. WBOS16]UUO33631.1 sugar ABC transporter substrate-binding protein [Bradyrhizobium sp. WBOS01]UUO39827.1 sugar ABC transporter substrate-binding protein [Bradyrhizobiu